MITAIDFTGSNGDPDMPNSLHYISPTGTCSICSAVIVIGVANFLFFCVFI